MSSSSIQLIDVSDGTWMDGLCLPQNIWIAASRRTLHRDFEETRPGILQRSLEEMEAQVSRDIVMQPDFGAEDDSQYSHE